MMIDQAKYIQSSYTLSFQRYLQIRRMANDFEDYLHKEMLGRYGQPQVVSVPDELDPEVPRLVFGSLHGFSQITISQVSISLNITYSPDWQTDINKGRIYLGERVPLLYEMLSHIVNLPALFSGLTTRLRLFADSTDSTFIESLRRLMPQPRDGIIHDVGYKIVTKHEGKFFSNLAVSNFRSWQASGLQAGFLRLPLTEVAEHGIEIIGDFNDRLAYNETESYVSQAEIAEQIIDGGLQAIKSQLTGLTEVLK